MTLFVNADIHADAMQNCPVYTLRRDPFIPERVGDVANALLPGITAARVNEGETREDLIANIHGAMLGRPQIQEDGSTVCVEWEGMQDYIAVLQTRLDETALTEAFYPADAVDVNRLPVNLVLRHADGNDSSLGASADSIGIATQRNMLLQQASWLTAEGGYTNEGPVVLTPTYSKEAAIQVAETFFNENGLYDLQLADSEPGRLLGRYDSKTYSVGWVLTYIKTFVYFPLPLNMLIRSAGFFRIESEQYAAAWQQEELRVYVDEDGIQSLDWINPLASVAIVNENVALLPFDQVMESARKYILAGMSWVDAETVPMGYSMEVTDVYFTAMLRPVKDDPDLAYLLPAWVICYRPLLLREDGSFAAYDTESAEAFAINAIDGTWMCLEAG
jgi:hypothetical protein